MVGVKIVPVQSKVTSAGGGRAAVTLDAASVARARRAQEAVVGRIELSNRFPPVEGFTVESIGGGWMACTGKPREAQRRMLWPCIMR